MLPKFCSVRGSCNYLAIQICLLVIFQFVYLYASFTIEAIFPFLILYIQFLLLPPFFYLHLSCVFYNTAYTKMELYDGYACMFVCIHMCICICICLCICMYVFVCMQSYAW